MTIVLAMSVLMCVVMILVLNSIGRNQGEDIEALENRIHKLEINNELEKILRSGDK